VEKDESQDGILVHRAAVRYHTLKELNPGFHAGNVGGMRHACFQPYEHEVVKSYILYFFGREPYATQAELASELARIFQRDVTVDV
jgi:hypothetical protein